VHRHLGTGADEGLVLDSVRVIAFARRAVEIGDRSDAPGR